MMLKALGLKERGGAQAWVSWSGGEWGGRRIPVLLWAPVHLTQAPPALLTLPSGQQP